MRKSKKTLTVISSGLIILGVILAAIGLFPGAKLTIINTDSGLKVIGNSDLQQEAWSIEEFKNIQVDVADANIEVIPSNEFSLEIERLDSTNISHTVENGTLLIKNEESSTLLPFAMNFSFNIQDTIIKIYVPKNTEFGDIMITNKFGDVQLNGLTSRKLNIHSMDGNITIDNIQSNDLAILNDYGDITGSNVKTEDLTLETKDGNTDFESIDTENAILNNHYGDTTLHQFTSKATKIESTDGELKINGKLLGQTVIHSKFGDIDLDLDNKESELSYTVQNSFGDILVNDNQYESKATNTVNSNNKMTIDLNDGDIKLTLK